jgi:hypothetical protein
MIMRTVSRFLAAVVFLALVLAPLAAGSDQLPLPAEKKLRPGVSLIDYGGQSLRFTSDVSLVVRLNPIDATRIRLEVRIYGGGTSNEIIQIHWMNWGADIHVGTLPSQGDVWILLTESGMTEK